MKSLKFLRNVAVYAVHREQGSIHEIEDKEAVLLIADGAAVAFEKPAKSSPETAAAKHPAKETDARK